jgi:hypothetical protein
MAPKRARTAAAAASASSSSQSAGVTKLTLHGGVPHHPALAGLRAPRGTRAVGRADSPCARESEGDQGDDKDQE